MLFAVKPSVGVGIDFSHKIIDLAREKYPELEFLVGNIDQLDIDETFDYVLINNIIGYAQDLLGAFEQIRKVCQPNTKIILLYHSHLWRPVLKLAEFLGLRMKWPDQHWLSTKDLENLLTLNNFRIITTHHKILCPIFIPFI